MTTVLITGILGRLARMVAEVLAADPSVRVVGADLQSPAEPVPGVEIYECGLRGPQMLDLIRLTGADVVVHLAGGWHDPVAASTAIHTHSGVVLTMELLGACAAAGVSRVVLRSGTFVYGAGPEQPMMLDETAPLFATERAGVLKDVLTIEQFVAGFVRRHTVPIVLLRCAWLAGSGIESPLTRYLRQSAPPVRFGFNPRIQVLHAADAAAAFALAALGEILPAAYNIASEPTLNLSQAVRLAGRWPFPLFGLTLDTIKLAARGNASSSLLLDPIFLSYSCVADTRQAREVLGFVPQYDAAAAIRESVPAV
jgi:UDP-glucose 4-epimerase